MNIILRILAACLLPTLALTSAALLAQAGAQGDQAALAPGPGREIVIASCGGCHAMTTVTNARYSPEQWAEAIDRMVDRGAQVDDKDFDLLVAYLAEHYGPAK